MKQLFFVATGCLLGLLSFAQLKHDSVGQSGKGSTPAERYKKPVPANLPEGTYTKNNKVFIKQGYKGVYNTDGKSVTIQRINTGGGVGPSAVGGSITCQCVKGSGVDDCKITIGNLTIFCDSDKGACRNCSLSVVVPEGPKVAMSLNIPENSNMNWKRIEIPKMQR
jgi:hypothetical protein